MWYESFIRHRPVALTARASDSKSEGWGFKSLLACHNNGSPVKVNSEG